MSKRYIASTVAQLTIVLALMSNTAFAQVPLRDDNSGPYNVTILEGGEGLTRKLAPGTASLDANAPWSMSGWVNAKRVQKGAAVLLAIGSSQQDGRALMLDGGRLSLWAGGATLAQRSRDRARRLDRGRGHLRRQDRAPLRERQRRSPPTT